jgi:hypothetical protein
VSKTKTDNSAISSWELDPDRRIKMNDGQKIPRLTLAGEWYGLKAFIKSSIALIPGYNRIIRIARGTFSKQDWVTRIPVAPTDVEVFVGDVSFLMIKPDRCRV